MAAPGGRDEDEPVSDVLVVDDSAQSLEILSSLLTAHGHQVRAASGGIEALRLVREAPPDLVLLDLHMPDLSGFEVCRRLRQTWDSARLPVVFLSAAEDAESRVKAFQLGAIDFVTKPFDFAEILARVDTHLELKRRTLELETSNQKLRDLEVARRRFITSLVHDIKGPLTPLLKNTEWLLEQDVKDEEITEVARDLHVASNYLHRMVLSLLDIARSDERGLTPSPRVTRIGPWLDDALTLARLQLRSQPERLVVQVDADAEASFDPALMARVLQNLIDNAVKYTPRTQPIFVEARVQNGGLQLVVEDRGPGVKPEDRDRIFEAWVQLDTPAPGRASHGVGLSFCLQAVEAHGGHLAVTDARPRGARFVVNLPAGR